MSQFPVDLVKFTEEILNEKLHFFVQCIFPFYFNTKQYSKATAILTRKD